MKKLLTIVSALLFSLTMFSQAYNSPESIEFDYANNRWFIANNGGNNILTRSSVTGALTVFASTGFSGGGPHGLEIVGDTLYACAGGSLRAYDINTTLLVFTKVITGASFLNGITHDNSGNLFITDYTNNKIFRFNTGTRSFNAFVSTGLSSPNGIIFDQVNNRCVFVQWAGSVKSVLLSDSTVSTLVASTGFSSCDGITKDGTGNYYLSSWSTTSKVTRYTSTFTSPVAVITSGLSNPADIFYNVLTDTLGVPNSGSGNNTTYHYFGATTAIEESEKSKFNFSVSPNPIAKTAEIKFETTAEGNVKIELFDVKGQLVETILDENQSKGTHSVGFDKSTLSLGNYFFTISTPVGTETKKIVIAE